MGLCASTGMSTDPKSKSIDKEMEQVRQQEEKIHKLLLLGAGDSGKSTIFKQITKTYGKGFTEKEFKDYINRVRDNITFSISVLAKECEPSGCLSLVKEDVRPLIEQAKDLACDHMMPTERTKLIKTLWDDPGIKATFFEHKSKYQIQDSAHYFLDKIEEIGGDAYVPTFDDVLRCRVPTTGINHIEFEIKKAQFRMYDVGGQRSERKKWINCFDGVTAVLFVASISEFDQSLYEDENVNRMEEAISLFAEYCNHEAFREVNVMLFLNKMDLLEQKLDAGIQFSDNFPEYTGENTFDPVKDHIKGMFIDRVMNDKEVYVHFTMATDTELIERIFASVKDHIIKGMLGGFGLL